MRAAAVTPTAMPSIATITAAIATALCVAMLLPAFRRHEFDAAAVPEPGADPRASTNG